ncbi:hypothetical protein QBC38DRAFT_456373 [Podospora fimiseda]|uniref:C2H2-type domain-containing protein n=1 Tax=Podospora fimiseda TaxID=252190 RepID=A0AAN7GT16_9PEZI|nr:hypothetical protein QBC38DRAFT_456373 [Podospora fimiseda]
MDNTTVDEQCMYDNTAYDPAFAQQSTYADQPSNGEPSTGGAENEYWCYEDGCKNPGPFPRRCDLKKHQNNHTRPRACVICPESTDPRKPSRFAETKELNRHYWTTHIFYAKENNIPGERVPCWFQGCDYKSRSDLVLRHYKKKHGNAG